MSKVENHCLKLTYSGFLSSPIFLRVVSYSVCVLNFPVCVLLSFQYYTSLVLVFSVPTDLIFSQYHCCIADGVCSDSIAI